MSQTLLCGPDSPPYISWFEFSPLTHADNPFFFYTQTQFMLVQCVSKSGPKPFTGCFLISQSLQPPLNKNSEQCWENQVRVLSLSFLICSTQQETTGNVLFVSRKGRHMGRHLNLSWYSWKKFELTQTISDCLLVNLWAVKRCRAEKNDSL